MAQGSHDVPPTLQSAALTAISHDAPVYDGYQALDVDRREMRLLDIGPGLQCTLRHAELDSKPGYYALSYYWGAPGQTRPITVNGSEVQLRVTLHRFFEVLQQLFDCLTVWVDVICINQRDRVEQSHQVVMMGEIYQAAIGVLAWLGESDADSDAAFDCVKSASRITGFTSTHQYLKQLLTRPYFTRAWIIQECVLNKNLCMFCGGRSADWTAIVQAMYHLEKKEQSASYIVAPNPVMPTEHPVWESIARMRGGDHPASSSVRVDRLRDNVLRFSGTRCLDPRDKVYAFLSLARDDDKVHVDYTSPAIDTLFQLFSKPGRSGYPGLIDDFRSLLMAMSLNENEVMSGLSPQPGDAMRLYSDYVRGRNLQQTYISPGVLYTLFPWPNSDGRFVSSWSAPMTLSIVARWSTKHYVYLLVRFTAQETDLNELFRIWETVSNTNGQSYPTKLKAMARLLIGRVKPCQQSVHGTITVHLDRVATIALVVLGGSEHRIDPSDIPQSLLDYARANPPGPDDVKCRCVNDTEAVPGADR